MSTRIVMRHFDDHIKIYFDNLETKTLSFETEKEAAEFVPMCEELLEVTEAIAEGDDSETFAWLLAQHVAVVKQKITVY